MFAMESFLLVFHPDSLCRALVGTDPTTLAEVIVDFITVPYLPYRIVRTDFLANSALLAGFLVDFRPLVTPASGLVV
jgi:hypothetical protein